MPSTNVFASPLQSRLRKCSMVQIWEATRPTKQTPKSQQPNSTVCSRSLSQPSHLLPLTRHRSETAGARLHAKTDTAIVCLLSMLDSNPAACLVQEIFKRNRRSHQSTIHNSLAHQDCLCKSLYQIPDIINYRKASLLPHSAV